MPKRIDKKIISRFWTELDKDGTSTMAAARAAGISSSYAYKLVERRRKEVKKVKRQQQQPKVKSKTRNGYRENWKTMTSYHKSQRKMFIEGILYEVLGEDIDLSKI